jgi:hypothetical protein
VIASSTRKSRWSQRPMKVLIVSARRRQCGLARAPEGARRTAPPPRLSHAAQPAAIDGWAINVKRTYRIYREEGFLVRERRRKKLPVPQRQPLVRPIQSNEVWSMDFVVDGG